MSQPMPANPPPAASSAQQLSDSHINPSISQRPTPKARSISFAAPAQHPRSTSFEAPNISRTTRRASTPPQSNSIKFNPSVKEPAKSPKTTKRESTSPVPLAKPRNRSPPPAATYHPRVSFNTFENRHVTDQEFTLVCKHNGYSYGRHQRVFLVAIDENAYSEHALKWVIEDMIEDGDEIICLRVVEPDPKTKAGATKAQMNTYRDDAEKLLKQVQLKNDAAEKKAISIIMEFACGSVEQIILHMIQIYSPAFLTVGTRGKSLAGLQGLLPGSVSKWCVQNSPVPVVVVRHPEKRKKKEQKRKKDENRKGYAKLQEKSATIPGNESTNTAKGVKLVETEHGEAEAVAIAVKSVSALDKRGIMGSRGARRSATSLDEISGTEEERRGESQSEGEEDEETDGEEEESDDESEDEDENPAGTEGARLERLPNDTRKSDRSLGDDVRGGTQDDEKDNHQ